MASATCVMELEAQTRPDDHLQRQDRDKQTSPTAGGDMPVTAVSTLDRWNYPRANLFRTLATFWSFAVLGASDAALGALIPYLEAYYGLTYTVISFLFLLPLPAYVLASLVNNRIHMVLGQRGIALIAPGCHLIAYTINGLHPPYPVLVVSFVITAFGNGLVDSAWNAWIGNMANANEVLGILHGLYGAGAVLSPLVSTSLITKANVEWYYFYYIMLACAALELVVCALSFWTATGAVFREANARSSGENKGSLRTALLSRPSARVTWTCACFLLGYVGIEVGLGGWIVTFMIRVRHGGRFASGMTATGFWLGITVGRLVLGFVTPRIGERIAIAIYIVCAMGCGLVLWLVPQFYASAVAVSLQGFFLAPLFPAAVVMTTKLLPRHLHVSAIGFAAAIGSGGAALLPFAVGAMAQAKGVEVLQPFILGLSGAILLLWLSLPLVRKAHRAD